MPMRYQSAANQRRCNANWGFFSFGDFNKKPSVDDAMTSPSSEVSICMRLQRVSTGILLWRISFGILLVGV
eukprot:6392011-Pyramimonas_sp.AAC.1